MIRIAAKFLCVLACMLAPHFASAQSYPTRTITMIVPFAPGGPADVLGRLVGAKMAEHLGQSVVIENRPGANTIIGAQAVARAKPDGYTILLAIDGTLVMNPYLYTTLSYDPFKGIRRGRRTRSSSRTRRPIPGSSTSARRATTGRCTSRWRC